MTISVKILKESLPKLWYYAYTQRKYSIAAI